MLSTCLENFLEALKVKNFAKKGAFLQKRALEAASAAPRLPDIRFAGFSAEPSGSELYRYSGYMIHSNLHLEAPRWTTCRKNTE